MKWRRIIVPVLLLPGTALVVAPALILWLTWNTSAGPRLAGWVDPRLYLGVGLGLLGLVLALATMRLFLTVGRGTPAPWDPPLELVVHGPYAHVRNPMISGVSFMIAAEALILGSWPLAVWLGVFFLGNWAYFPLREEKTLEKRFGDAYLRYRANVPRWVPRWRAWDSRGDEAGGP